MGINIQLTPEQQRRLTELATEQGRSPTEVLDDVLSVPQNGSIGADLLDVEYHNYARAHADSKVTGDDVRNALARIRGSLADAVVVERDER